ncbi:MAG: DUF92 domain-containing protein, partial [Candidatus Zixiibacteriota bacterium]
VPPGSSGGVTGAGLAGSLAGAVLVAALGRWADPAALPAAMLLPVALAGFSGGLFDSVLGATLQERRRCEACGKITEKTLHCGRGTVPAAGLPGLNNDTVNLLCTAFGAVAAGIWMYFINL